MKNIKRLLILSFAIFSLEAKALHPLKMSVTDIIYKDKKFYLKCKLFTDDLEMTLRAFCNKGQIDLINVGFDAVATKCLQEHFQKNFLLSLNGAPVRFTFKKVYLSTNVEVVYVEMEATVKLVNENRLAIINTLMFSNLPEQKNVVNLTREGNTKTLLIENGKEEKAKEVLFLNPLTTILPKPLYFYRYFFPIYYF